MNERKNLSGAQFQGDRPQEQEVVRTTIVGGRPPGSGQSLGHIPRGLEVLLKKAAIDPEFKELLLVLRAEAAAAIGLKLEPNEILLLKAAPKEQLEAVIAQTRVPEEHRRAFLGRAAAAMLAALGVLSPEFGCDHEDQISPKDNIVSAGIAPDRPPPPKGIAPDQPPFPPRPLLSSAPDQVEKHVKECIATRFQVERNQVFLSTDLVQDLKATEIQLAGLKRQLEQDYIIKLPGQDFFKKVPTVGELIKTVQTAVKTRSAQPAEPKPEPPPTPLGIRPGATRGTRPN